MNSATLSSYFVRVKIPMKNGHAQRTGIIVAYDSLKDEPQTEDLLMLAYITNEEKTDWQDDKDNKPWEVNFLAEGGGADKISSCEVREWKKADDKGYFALLAEISKNDEGRRYEAFSHFKERKILRLDGRGGVVLWTLSDSGEIQTNLDRQVEGKALTCRRLEKPKIDDNTDALYPLAADGEQSRQNSQEIDDLGQSLVGAAVFRDDGKFVGCCCSPASKADYVKMDCAWLNFDIAAALEKCGRSRVYEAIEEGLINAKALAEVCTEIKKQLTSPRDLLHRRNDFRKPLPGKVLPYFNRVSLERFLLHTRSGLKHLLESSNLLVKWREMLSSLQKLGKTSIASLALLWLLSGTSTNSHAMELAKLHGSSPNISLDAYPLYLDSLGIKDEDVIHLAVFIRSIQKDEPLPENNWHIPFGSIKEDKYQFALDLYDHLNAKDKQALCELMDEHYPNEEDEHRKQHIELALALHRLAMPEADTKNLPLDWQTLVQAIEKDIFCLH